LAKKGLDGLVSYKIDERGLVVGLISNELFFVADTAELTSDSRAVIDALTPTLKKIDNELSIDGHANSLPSTQYRSNWELSSDRATQVLRRFVEQGKLDPVRIKAVGYGDARPLLPNDTAEGLRANRRVDIVVMSSEPERVRELIPRIIEEHMASLANDSVGDNSDAPASGTKD
jgi:chemotaxis protein MotB